MAGPINGTFIEGQIIKKHEIELQNKALRAQYAFALLNQYNWNGVGAMPNVTWTAPTTFQFEYSNSYGELWYKSIPYSGLNAEQKREFWIYLPKFITICMKTYDDNYGL
jgi:hypothetical protein